MPFFEWVQSTAIARTVGESLWLTAGLSALHLIGFTLVMGGAVMVGLRLLGATLEHSAVAAVSQAGRRILLSGVVVSIGTGLLLFAPRAGFTIVTGTFQLKLTLAAAALLFHFLVVVRVAAAPQVPVATRKLTGLVSVLLWLSLAVTACWFILFE
jgi:hypothetical protein